MTNESPHGRVFLGILKEIARKALRAAARGLTNGAQAFKMGYRKAKDTTAKVRRTIWTTQKNLFACMANGREKSR